jgi:hypothetical protein
MLYIFVNRWLHHDITYRTDELGQELQPRQWSKLVLAAWDFRLRPGEDRRNWEQALSNQLRSLQADEKEMEQAAQRTSWQRYCLYLRRAVGIFLNMCLIAGAWLGISWATVQSHGIKKGGAKALGSGLGGQIGAFLPNIIVALVGSILPTATKTITKFEAWSPTVRARHDLWRLYIGKILNIFIFVALNVELVMGEPLFGQKEVLEKRDTHFGCAEDQAAVKLLSLVASEFLLSLVLRPVNSLLVAYVWHVLFKSCSISSGFEKPQFELADYSVDTIYFQCLLWSTAVWSPWVVVASPILLLADFKWKKVSLFRLSSRPFVAETAALSVELLRLTILSCLFFVAMAYTVSTRPLPHAAECGPFESRMAPGAMLGRIDAPGSETVKDIVTWCKDHPGVLLPIIAALFFAGLQQRTRSKALHATLGQVQNASQRHVEALEGELWRMERQNELLNRRVQWHEKTSD